MLEANTTNDVFRYVHLRPARVPAGEDDDVGRAPDDGRDGRRGTDEPDGGAGPVPVPVAERPGERPGDRDGDVDVDVDGDVAVEAARVRPGPVGEVLADAAVGDDVGLGLDVRRAGGSHPHPTAARRRRQRDRDRAALRAAADELAAVVATAPPPTTTSPPGRRLVITVPDRLLARLSPRSRAVLGDRGLDPTREGLLAVLGRIEGLLTAPDGADEPGPDDPPPPEEEERPYLRTAGVAELLVVKQHLTGYERTEIAHVENVMATEHRSRTHRNLERVEETFTLERETTRETETELETAERFEMQKETSRTIEEDHRFNFGLTISGRYGPSVEFSSNSGMESSTSTQETAQSATTYAKDVMSRSLERIVERVREEQVRRVLREQEETNVHEFDNRGPGAEHVVGVYQFLEKVYESQVFSYGLREVLDLMVPEPAAHLWWLEGSPSQGLNLPTPPPRLSTHAASAHDIRPETYLQVAALYGVDGLQPPPPYLLIATAAVHQGGEGVSEEDQPRSVVAKDVPVPDGYIPWYVQVMPLALTDDDLTLAVSVGGVSHIWQPAGGEITDVHHGDHALASATLGLGLAAPEAHVTGSTLTVQLVAFETATYGATIQVYFLRLPDAYTRWQIATYDALAAAYADAVKRYDVQVAELKAAAEQAARQTNPFGRAPSQNAVVVREELKRQCLEIITRQRFEEPNGMVDADPPYFDFPTAAERGAFTRFFEQSFEWDQLQYVCYPYYWARPTEWSERLRREDVDPAFLEFFKAGAARVVVPVRPGFEVAVSHYLETGRIWNGEGEPPDVESDTYLPIVTEIRERTGADEGEVPVGDPWETRVPTPLVILREEGGLPAWVRTGDGTWSWKEVLEADDDGDADDDPGDGDVPDDPGDG